MFIQLEPAKHIDKFRKCFIIFAFTICHTLYYLLSVKFAFNMWISASSLPLLKMKVEISGNGAKLENDVIDRMRLANERFRILADINKQEK